MTETTILKELKKGLIAWYDFLPGTRILYIGAPNDAIAEYLTGKSGEKYDSDGNLSQDKYSIAIVSAEGIMSEAFVQTHDSFF